MPARLPAHRLPPALLAAGVLAIAPAATAFSRDGRVLPGLTFLAGLGAGLMGLAVALGIPGARARLARLGLRIFAVGMLAFMAPVITASPLELAIHGAAVGATIGLAVTLVVDGSWRARFWRLNEGSMDEGWTPDWSEPFAGGPPRVRKERPAERRSGDGEEPGPRARIEPEA